MCIRDRITSARATVGRERSMADVVLRDPNVSRRHAQLTYTGSDWSIEDLNSTNGTIKMLEHISGRANCSIFGRIAP